MQPSACGAHDAAHHSAHVLMVEPHHFDVVYRINPWMRPGVDGEAALAQWKDLAARLERLGTAVAVGRDVEGLPDMAFAMNAGFVTGRRVVLSRFRHPERQREEPHWKEMLTGLGFEPADLDVAPAARFEGGDVLDAGEALVGGWGFRSDRVSLDALNRLTGRPVIPLRLVDPRFYHLDTCFCPLPAGGALAYLDAFDPADRGLLRDVVPHLVALTESEAVTFVANSVVVGDTFLTARCPPRVGGILADLGLRIERVDVGEFHLSGGSVRCLTLPLDIP